MAIVADSDQVGFHDERGGPILNLKLAASKAVGD